MEPPITLIDRFPIPSRDALVAAIKFHISVGTTVRVEDSARPLGKRFCYQVSSVEGAIRLLDAGGQHLGLFATVTALVDYADTRIREPPLEAR